MFDKAIYYCDKAISEAEKTGDSLLIADAYVYGGSPYSHAGNQEKFRDLILKAITILEAKDQNYTLLEAYLQISFYYVDAKDYRNADHYSDKALRLAHKLNITNPMTDAAILRARVLWEQHRFEEAKPFLAEAEIYSKKDGSVHCLRQYHTAMYMYNQEKGDYKQALFHYDLDRYLEDSLQNVQTQEATLAMEKKYQADTKQLQIEKLEKEGLITHLQLTQKERLIWMLLVMTILTGLLAASIFMYLKRKNQVVEAEKRLQIQRVKELETEKQLLATTSILKGQDEERARVARDLHDGLGGLLSGLKFSLGNLKGNMVLDKENADIFTKSLIQLDTVIGEMRRVAHSMMPESLVRFGLKEAVQDLCENISESGQSKIHFQAIGMEMGLDQSVSVAIYRIVQELVNNILKHANATEVQVQLVRDEKHIHLTIEDNGKGFDSQSVAHRRGAGLTNIQTRIDFLGGDLDIRSKPGEGTSVMIGITV